MSSKSDVKINNTVVLATIVDVTQKVITALDGDGIDTQNPDNPVTQEVLNKLIASRMRNKLASRNL